MYNNSKRVAKIKTKDGTTSAPSRSLVVLNLSPPKWKSFPDGSGNVSSLSNQAENFFVYNFYTLEERNLYKYENSQFDFRKLRGIDGKLVQKNTPESNRVATGLIPSFIRLSWDVSDTWNSSQVGEHNQIEDFKKITGLKPINEEVTNFFHSELTNVPIRSSSSVSFEVHQRDWVNITNEYLDMFSDLSLLSNPINNPWFAEEVDGSNYRNRFNFLRSRVVGNPGSSRNFLNVYDGTGRNPLRNQTEEAPDTRNIMVPYTLDKDLVENLEYVERFESPDITLVMNSEHAADISRASLKSSGKILSTESRIRNHRHLIEWAATFEGDEESFESPLQRVLNNHAFYRDYIGGVDFGVHRDPLLGSLSDFRIVGFVIEKEETYFKLEENVANQSRPDGLERRSYSRKYPLIFVPCERSIDESNPEIPSSYLDAAVNYGSEYRYSVRSVFSFKLSYPSGNGYRVREYLVNSSYSKSLQLSCLEINPPPPPRDFTAFFDFTKKSRNSIGKINLSWAFPVNKQRDTAGFAIFRRDNIYSPFKLLKILDFNYSIKNPRHRISNYKFNLLGPYGPSGETGEGPIWDNTNLVKFCSHNDSYTNYVDNTLVEDKEYIYTLCTIDAHGQISNYGTQLMINFNSRVSRLNIEQISPPGAPLIFPNWFLPTKAFQDVARASKYRKAVLKFRPDYKEIGVGENNAKMKVVNGTSEIQGGNEKNMYYMQIINPDRGQDVVLRYQINDKIESHIDDEELERVAEMLGVSIEDLE